jgi:hypothetical protein
MCALEIIGKLPAFGQESIELSCNGPRPVEVGVDTTIIKQQQIKLFTGVHVSPRCQLNATIAKGLDMRRDLRWLDEAVLYSEYYSSSVYNGSARLHLLLYFCGNDDLDFSSLVITKVWLPMSLESTPLSKFTDAPLPMENMFTDMLNATLMDNLYGAPPHIRDDAGDFNCLHAQYMFPNARKMGDTLGAIGVMLGRNDSLKLTAVVGFGGRVSAHVMGVLQFNVVCSLIVATEYSRIHLEDTRVIRTLVSVGVTCLQQAALL